MMTLMTIAVVVLPGGAIGLLLKIAIACVIFWAIKALLDWAGVVIPRPIVILAIALACIILIYWLFELAEMVL